MEANIMRLMNNVVYFEGFKELYGACNLWLSLDMDYHGVHLRRGSIVETEDNFNKINFFVAPDRTCKDPRFVKIVEYYELEDQDFWDLLGVYCGKMGLYEF